MATYPNGAHWRPCMRWLTGLQSASALTGQLANTVQPTQLSPTATAGVTPPSLKAWRRFFQAAAC